MVQLYFFRVAKYSDTVSIMNKKNIILLIVNSGVLTLFLLFTNPYKLPLLLLLLPGINTLFIAYCVMTIIAQKTHLNATFRRLITAVLLSSLAVTGVLLSLGQFTPRDFMLLLSFTLIGIFYVYRMWDTKS